MLKDRATLIIVMFVAALFRFIPQLQTGIYATGYDTTSGYIISTLNPIAVGTLSIFNVTLIQILLWLPHAIYGLNPFLELRFATPIFYGVLIASFFFMLRNGLAWSYNRSLLVTIFFGLEPDIMRLGWDLLRQEAALSVFFVLIGLTGGRLINSMNMKSSFSEVILSILIVLIQQQVALILFVVVAWQLIHSPKSKMINAMLRFLPSFLIFCGFLAITAFPTIIGDLPTLYLSNGVTGPNIVIINSSNSASSFLVNYFQSDPRFIGGSYLTILSYVFSLSIYTVLPLVPLAVYGFYRERVFLPMMLLLIVLGYGIIADPSFSFADYSRWIILLPIPLTIYASIGLYRILSLTRPYIRWSMISVILAVALILSASYSIASLPIDQRGQSYIPSSMSATAFPLGELPELGQITEFVNTNFPQHSSLFVSLNYGGFLKENVRKGPTLFLFPAGDTIVQAMNLVKLEDQTTSYLMWSGNQTAGIPGLILVTGDFRLGLYQYTTGQ